MVVSVYSVTATVDGAATTVTLNYDANDLANIKASVLNYSIGVATEPGDTATGPFSNLIIPASYTGVPVGGAGFSKIVVGTTPGVVTIHGGVAVSQLVFASDSGINFTSAGATATTILGGGGNSVINLSGNTASDVVALTGGSNSVLGGSGPTIYYPGTGSSTFIGGSGSDTVYTESAGGLYKAGSGGSSAIVGGTAPVTIIGGGNNDTLGSALSGSDLIEGAAGSTGELIYSSAGTSGADTLMGGGGSNETIYAGAASDSISTGSGNGIFVEAVGANDTVVSGSGTATINLDAANGVVSVGSGNDTIQAFAPGGTIYGGTSTSTPLIVSGSAAVTVFGAIGPSVIYGGVGGGVFQAAALNIINSGGGATTLLGAPGAILQGNYQNTVADYIQAGGGNESLDAGFGADTLQGSLTGFDAFGLANVVSGTTYTITNFVSGNDTLYVRTAALIAPAIDSQTHTNGSTTFTLNGATVTLVGYNNTLTTSNFTHG